MQCIVFVQHETTGLIDSLGRQNIPARVPYIGEEIRIKRHYYRVVRVIHSPDEDYAAELFVEYVGKAHVW